MKSSTDDVEISTKFVASFARLLGYELFIFSVCLFGDNYSTFLDSKSEFNSQLLKALIDSLTHGLLGFFSWAVVIDLSLSVTDLKECFGCLILAMSVDSDHFIAARSFQLKHALALPTRPVFHASSIILLVAVIIFTLSQYFKEPRLKVLVSLFLVAWTSHHIRDATRRGLWFPPLGSTPPLSRATYMALTMLLPVMFRIVLQTSGFIAFDSKGHRYFFQKDTA